MTLRSLLGWLLLLATAIVVPGSAPAQERESADPANSGAQPDAVEPTLQNLTLHAARQPDPLLRYRLWPAAEDRRDANPVPRISRAVILNLQVPAAKRKQFSENYDKWADVPLDELPVDQISELLAAYGPAMNELAFAENLMRMEYNLQLDQLSASQMIQTLLPELQEMRQLARLLSLRARVAISQQRWNDAIADCRRCFRLGEVAGHSTEFLISRLVGFAISSVAMDVIEEAIQQPDCPSLYWALASLPASRLFETRGSIEFESVLMSRVFQSTKGLPDVPIGEEEARQRIRELAREAAEMMSLAVLQDDQANVMTKLLTGVYVVALADASRELLAETPSWGQRAMDLSASEAVLRATDLKFNRIRDRWVAWSMLPPHRWAEYEPEREQAFGVNASSIDVALKLASLLMPAVDAAMNAGRRSHQRQNLLLTLEALRLHAGQRGELPKSLVNLRPVPAWDDSIAVEPFGYRRNSPTTATLLRAPRYPSDTETIFQIELKGDK